MDTRGKRRLRNYLIAALLFFGLSPLPVQAQNNVYDSDVVSLAFVENIFSSLLSIMIRLVGIGVFVMIVVGGLQYLFSGGDKEAVSHAKATITKAITGLLLIFGAWFVLLFISKITGNPSILQFDFIL